MKALALCIMLAMSAPALAKGDSRDLFAQAKEAWTKRDFPKALKLLREVYARDGRPLVLYNMGRVLEEMGQLREAHAVFVRVLAHPHVSPSQRQLATNEAARLSPLLEVAVLRLAGVPRAAVVQVDGAATTREGPDVKVAPGPRQVCVTTRASRARCWSLVFTKGERIGWPFPTGPRGVITLPPNLTRVDLNGHPLVVAPGTFVGLEVEARVHRIRMHGPTGVVSTEVFVAAGQTVAVASTLSGATSKAAEPSTASAGAAPWVTLGLGIATLGAGSAVLALGHDMAQEVSGAPLDASGRRTGMSENEALRRWEQANDLSTAGIIMTVVGAAGIVGGAIWAALAEDGEQQASVNVAVNEHAWLLGLGGRF